MKALFMIPSLGAGGAERALTQLANALSERIDVSILTLFKEGKYIQELNQDIHYSYVFKKVFRGNIHIFKLFSPEFLFKRMIKGHYDVIVSYLEGPTTRIVSGCKDPSVKIINWVHTAATNKDVFLKSYRNEAEFVKCMNKYETTVFVAQTAQKAFEEQFNISLPHETVVYNPIDNERILKQSMENTDVTLPANSFNIVTVGRLSKVKGFDRLIDICAELKKKANIHLYIVGNGGEENSLKERVAALKAESYVSFLGFRSNPFPIVKQASLYVCSSYREGYSTSVIEALVLGVPVVTTECSGMREILGEGIEYGVITENSDRGLLCGLEKMITDDAFYEKIKEKTRERGKMFNLRDGIEKTLLVLSGE